MHGHHEQGLLSVAMPRPGRPGREQEASQMLYRVSIGYARPCLLRFPFCPISIDGSWLQRHGCHLIDATCMETKILPALENLNARAPPARRQD